MPALFLLKTSSVEGVALRGHCRSSSAPGRADVYPKTIIHNRRQKPGRKATGAFRMRRMVTGAAFGAGASSTKTASGRKRIKVHGRARDLYEVVGVAKDVTAFSLGQSRALPVPPGGRLSLWDQPGRSIDLCSSLRGPCAGIGRGMLRAGCQGLADRSGDRYPPGIIPPKKCTQHTKYQSGAWLSHIS